MKLPVRLFSAAFLAASLGLAVCANAAIADSTILAGHRIPAASATQTIVVGPQTRYVNLDSGDDVLFKTPTGQFAFHVDKQSATPFDLSAIAPAGAVDHPVAVYIKQGVDDPYAG